MTYQKRIFAILGIFTGLIMVQACGRVLTLQASCNFVQNSALQRVSWESSVPVDIYLDAGVPSDYVSSIQAAINRWNTVGQSMRGTDFFRLRAGSPGSATPAQDNYSKIYVLDTWEKDRSNEQARTTVYWSGSKIYEADMRINHKDFDFYFSDTTPDYTKVHLESLVLHELGHVLGLAHTTVNGSVMQASLANGTTRTNPNATDMNDLKCEY